MKKFLKTVCSVLIKSIGYFFVGALVVMILFYFFGYNDVQEQRMESIIERPNCTLVRVRISLYDSALGYVDNDIIAAFANGTLNQNVTVHHPFEENGFRMVNGSIVQTITTMTKQELLDEVDY